jgi:polar amino acid transport system permease protein
MHEVLQKFFSPHSFRVALPDVWTGFQLNLKLMVVAEILVLVLALAIAVVRGLPGRGAAPFRALAIVYTDVFRGTPLILVAFLVGFGLPGLNVHVLSTQSNFVYGVTALTLVYTAYVTEVYRAGIESVHLLNDFVGLQKDTALVTVIGVAEAAQQAQQFSQNNYNFTSYIVAAVFFILLTIPLARFTDHLILMRERRESAQAT